MKRYIAILLFIAGFSTTAMAQSEPPYGMSEIEAYSIFYDNYRQGEYDMALQFGRWMLEKKPREIEGFSRFSLPTQYERMSRIFVEKAEMEEDPSLKAAYFDSARIVYQEALEMFTEDEIDHFEWKFNLGQFYQRHSSFIDDGMAKAYSTYEELFNENPERLTEAADGYYARILLQKYVNDGEREKALSLIDTIEPLADANLQEAITQARDDIFSDPVERIEFLESQLAEEPENTELLNELATLYESQGNREKAIEMAERLYEIEPDFENTRQLANIALENANYAEAIEYLNKAAETAPDITTKRNITLQISEAYQNMGNFQQARSYARQASELDSDWGQPFIRIARIYAGTISSCTRNRTIDRGDRRVYWLVLDYLDRARNVDSSVSNEVQRLYNSYEPVLPSDEDKFFQGWEPGDQVVIDGSQHECYSWIDETTTVR